MYDLLIRDARVVYGTGNPWFRVDIGVKNGSITAVGRIEDKAGRIIRRGSAGPVPRRGEPHRLC